MNMQRPYLIIKGFEKNATNLFKHRLHFCPKNRFPRPFLFILKLNNTNPGRTPIRKEYVVSTPMRTKPYFWCVF